MICCALLFFHACNHYYQPIPKNIYFGQRIFTMAHSSNNHVYSYKVNRASWIIFHVSRDNDMCAKCELSFFTTTYVNMTSLFFLRAFYGRRVAAKKQYKVRICLYRQLAMNLSAVCNVDHLFIAHLTRFPLCCYYGCRAFLYWKQDRWW